MKGKKGLIVALICAASLTLLSCNSENKESERFSTRVYKVIDGNIERASSISNEKIIVEKNKKFGVQDIDGGIIEEIDYDKIMQLTENVYYFEKDGIGRVKNIVTNREIDIDEVGKISEDYLKIVSGNKYGIVDKNLNWVVPLEYDYLDSDKEYVIAIKNGETDVFDIDMKKLDLQGKKKVVLGIGKYLYNVKNSKLGIIDGNGEVLVDTKYDNFLKLNNKDILIGYKNGEKFLINLSKKSEMLIDYENFGEEAEGLILTLKDGKLGYIDDKGKQVIPNKYNIAFKAQKESKYLQVKEGDKWLLIDKNGKVYRELPYDDLGEYKDGYTLVMLDNKFGYIDKEGNEKIPPQFLYATSFDGGYAIVGAESGLGIIDKKNKIVIPMIYDDINVDGKYVYVKMDNKKGILDLSGQEILPVIYDDLGEVKGGILFYKKENEAGYIQIEKGK